MEDNRLSGQAEVTMKKVTVIIIAIESDAILSSVTSTTILYVSVNLPIIQRGVLMSTSLFQDLLVKELRDA